MRLQSAIFDMDGTLLDSMGMWSNLGFNLLLSHSIEPRADFRDQIKTMKLRDGVAYCKDAYGLSESMDELMDSIWAQVERFYRDEVTAKPGVEKFLSLLKMEGVWMYVATATDRPLAEIALRRAGIRDYFQGILTCGEVGASKDHPDIYERALTRLRSTKRDTVVFEDAPFAIRTAKHAGFRVAAVYDPSAEASQAEIQRISDYYIYSFEEMFETLES